jgi:hypothetical protein
MDDEGGFRWVWACSGTVSVSRGGQLLCARVEDVCFSEIGKYGPEAITT